MDLEHLVALAQNSKVDRVEIGASASIFAFFVSSNGSKVDRVQIGASA